MGAAHYHATREVSEVPKSSLEQEKMKLDIGCGQEQSIREGFIGIDAKFGGKAFPPLTLNDGSVVEDGSCDVIVASHILEHAGHAVTERILQHWVSKLRPGGLIKIAVPDLEYIATRYLSGAPGPYSGWLYGGQVDQNDIHGAAFDFDSLSAMMRRAGLVGIHMWGLPGEQDQDSSCLEVSLNLAGYKRPEKWPKTISVMSAPRLAFMDQQMVASDALLPLGIPTYIKTGAYWATCMYGAIQSALEDGAEFVLTLDYDSLFTIEDVEDLLAFLHFRPDADVVAPMQMHRMNGKILMNPKAPEGAQSVKISFDELEQTYYPIKSAHFGATLFRASAFAKLERPWFQEKHNEQGDYGAGHVDADVAFWLNLERNGGNAFLVPRVVIGHIEPFVLWPDRKLKTIRQHITEWRKEHRPRDCWR